jgi:hypothetical protein
MGGQEETSDIGLDYVCHGILTPRLKDNATDWLIESIDNDLTMGMMILTTMIHDEDLSIDRIRIFDHLSSLIQHGAFDKSMESVSPFSDDFVAAIYSLFELMPERLESLYQFQENRIFSTNAASKLRQLCLNFVLEDESETSYHSHPPRIWPNLEQLDTGTKEELLTKEEVRYTLESSILDDLQHISTSNSHFSAEPLLHNLDSLYSMIDFEETGYLSSTFLGGYIETLGQAYFLLAKHMENDEGMLDCFEKSRFFLTEALDVVEDLGEDTSLPIRAFHNPSFEHLPWDELNVQQSMQLVGYIDSLIGGEIDD